MAAVVVAATLAAGVATVFVLPGPRQVAVHDVLGFVDRSGQVTVESVTVGQTAEGVRVPFHGRVFESCRSGISWLELTLRTAITLTPQSYTIVNLDLPKAMIVAEPTSPSTGPEVPREVTISLPVKIESGATGSSAVELVLFISGDRVATYRVSGGHRGPIIGG